MNISQSIEFFELSEQDCILVQAGNIGSYQSDLPQIEAQHIPTSIVEDAEKPKTFI